MLSPQDAREAMEKLTRAFGRKEELHPDLKRCLRTHHGLGVCLEHPLVVQLMYSPPMNSMLNAQYEAKNKRVAEVAKCKDFNQYVFLHERKFRLDALLDVTSFALGTGAHLRPEVFGSGAPTAKQRREAFRLIGEVWIDAEYVWANRTVWQLLFSLAELDPECGPAIMDEADTRIYKILQQEPKRKIYRGVSHPTRGGRGFSWTTCSERAEWFARRFSPEYSAVLHAEVDPGRILACFNGRGEHEVIPKPSLLRSGIKYERRVLK